MGLEETNTRIRNKLSTLSGELNLTIIYACESGSRAWGFASPDSDYDVRFLYVHPVAWYLKLHEDKDVIDVPIEHTPDGILDLGGWDLRKTLRLVAKSNPVIWEWLQSPIRYQQAPFFDHERFLQVIAPFYSPITACHHYLSICRNSMAKEWTGEQIKIKKYFYRLRPLLAAMWIENTRTVPPMELQPLITMLANKPNIKQEVLKLWQLKQQTDEQIPINRIPMLDNFIVNELDHLQTAAPLLPASKGNMDDLNQLFHAYLELKEAN